MVGRKKKVQYEHVYGMMRDFALISVTNGCSLYTMANRKFYYTATIAVWPRLHVAISWRELIAYRRPNYSWTWWL